jgi:superfamily II DNA or RNA helicase
MPKSYHSDSPKTIITTKIVYPQVYSYTLPDEPDNEGSQKIGYTERKDVDKRIHEQTQTAAKRLRFEKKWSAPAFFSDDEQDFRDTDFHKFLIKSDVQHRPDLGKEWFYFNGTPEKSKQLFDTFRQQGFAALQNNGSKTPYELRNEQRAAVDKAINYFDSHTNGEFLWNAKPRFGKTLASYDLVIRLKAKKVLIVTNRPAIANSWFDDFEMFIEGYYFISDTRSLAERKALTREQFIEAEGAEKKMVTFLSLQDLKGSKYFGGPHDKLRWVADLDWDLLIIDEAHEGVDTGRTNAAFEIIKRKNTLHLSGTPFKALSNQKFASDAIFNWTYIDEQKEKKKELTEGESGPHTDLPDLRLYAYRISQMIADEVNEGIDIDDENRDYAFDLNEFFATKDQKFVHENDVREFLRNLSTNEKYPFSTPELRDQLRHTFWYVGSRIESVKALEQLLKHDAVFKDYKIIVAAGDGKSFDEEEADFSGNEKSFNKVKKAIAENPLTITLSCGQLTTGVTVKEWSAVLMLTDIKTPSQYMQAAFRAQNPYRFTENGAIKAKKSAYLFDFAPTRVLEIYENFANGLNNKAATGELTLEERKENVKELLNYFPVISEDVDGKMVELDAEKVLTFPNALAATEIVQARFMTNLLFNDNIKGVFHFPKEVEEILDKMPVEKNKRAETSKEKLDLDDARKIEQGKQTKINENTGVILGEKIYRANIERVVDNVLDQATPEETIDMLPQKVESLVEAPIAKLREQYKLTAAEADELRKETAEKIKIVVSEFENSDDKDPEKLKQDLANVIEHDLVQAKVEQQETKAVETVQKSKEEEVREHLRAFTRTIPMFVMANSSRDTITIDNFDEQISDEDFIHLTNITKEEFHKLRDGFGYTDDNGERKRFEGVFHKYKFNASIAEFVLEKQKRANYFKTDKDIFELIPNQKNNQIFTPRTVVKMMIDGLEKEQPELFKRTDSTFIDLYMKSGMYVTEIVKKLFAGTRHNYSSDTDCLKHILENQVYGLAPTGVLHGITTSYIFGFDIEYNISNKNFVQHDLLPEAKDGSAALKIAQLYNGGKMIKFDAVVGNPPYQVSMEGGKDMPIYPYFYDLAEKISDRYCLISPARFLFGAGATSANWNNKMLNDKHLKVLYFNQNSSEVFPTTDIKGGVAVLCRDANQNFGAIETFTSFNELNSILLKVVRQDFKSLGDLIYGVTSYTFAPKAYEDFPCISSRVGKGSGNQLTSGIFDAVPEIFMDEKQNDKQIKIFGRQNNERVYKWVELDYIRVPDNLNSYKVFIPAANGSGAIGEVLSTPLIGQPLIGQPLIGHSATFISMGNFKTKDDAEALLKYVKTKFARTMLGIKKTTQHNKTRDVWSKVPIQNFTSDSGVDWSKSIPEIDQQLYKKYGLSQEEIDFIETRVKPME